MRRPPRPILAAVAVLSVLAGIALGYLAALEGRDVGDAFSWWLQVIWQVLAFGAFQTAVAAFVWGWVIREKLTWGWALVAAVVATAELIVLFGVIPSQWLTLAQGPSLGWVKERLLVDLPGNSFDINLYALSDIIAAGINGVFFGALVVFVYQVQSPDPIWARAYRQFRGSRDEGAVIGESAFGRRTRRGKRWD